MSINDPKYHRFYQYRNQEVKWLCIDSEQRYQENLKNNYEKLKKYGWLDKEISYKLNSEGFRSDDFSNDDSIVFFGPSITMGIGLSIEDIYPTLVANELKLKCFNLAIAGTSNDTSFRLAYTWLERIKPKIVVFHSEWKERLELLDYDFSHNLSPAEVKSQFFKVWLEVDENSYLNKLKNSLAIQCLCQQHNIKFIELDRKSTIDTYIDYESEARDLLHPGPKAHRAYSDIILKLIGA